MKILNFGSLNIDRVFSVAKIAHAGQTIASSGCSEKPGGKGLNQSIALARAGAQVFHAGLLGQDGHFLRVLLEKNGVDCRYLQTLPCHTGSAFIQVEENGQNCIVLDGGANMQNTPALCKQVLADFGSDDVLLLQNEVNCLPFLIDLAYEKQMTVVLNPSPMNETVLQCDLSKVSVFLLNEDEGALLTGAKDADTILQRMSERFSAAAVVLTLGSKGSVYQKDGSTVRQKAFCVKAVDTTAAGDTFTGYFLAALTAGEPVAQCLSKAAAAAAIAVTRFGAAPSIPMLAEVAAF